LLLEQAIFVEATKVSATNTKPQKFSGSNELPTWAFNQQRQYKLLTTIVACSSNKSDEVCCGL